jgi:two-component sensor histidine kinase
MNSLQFVASLLNLQSRLVGAEAAGQLTAAEHRVLAIAQVHRSFAVDKSADRVDMPAYLRRLCGELSTILDTEITVAGSEAASVPTMQVLAIGIIVNELVTNAKKHGRGQSPSPSGPAPPGNMYFACRTTAAALPKGFAVDRSGRHGIGMKVVVGLVEQLAGGLSRYGNPTGRGTCVSVSFPVTTQ